MFSVIHLLNAIMAHGDIFRRYRILEGCSTPHLALYMPEDTFSYFLRSGSIYPLCVLRPLGPTGFLFLANTPYETVYLQVVSPMFEAISASGFIQLPSTILLALSSTHLFNKRLQLSYRCYNLCALGLSIAGGLPEPYTKQAIWLALLRRVVRRPIYISIPSALYTQWQIDCIVTIFQWPGRLHSTSTGFTDLHFLSPLQFFDLVGQIGRPMYTLLYTHNSG